jgi:hypothetical protein
MIELKNNFFKNFMIKNIIHIILLIIYTTIIYYIFSFNEFVIIFYNIIILIKFKNIIEKGPINLFFNISPNLLYIIYKIYNINIIFLWLKGCIIYFGIILMLEKYLPEFLNSIIHYDFRNIFGFILTPIFFSNIYVSLIFYDIIFFYINNDNIYNLIFL